MIRIIAVIIVVLASSVSESRESPLFQSSEQLLLTLEFPVQDLKRNKEEKPVLGGVLRYTDDDGNEVTIDMNMSTRGKSRLNYCGFPPLTLNLKRKQAIDTVFDGQNKLKIVTHCRNGGVHLRYLLQEYGIYRAFNVLSDYSYRVRLLKITYRDSEGNQDDEVHDAFFIESHNEVARRNDMERLRVPRVYPEQLEAQQAATYTLFQYLIANTDWSMLQGPGEDGCCHNGKVIIKPESQENWIVLPYDFDQAGLINTKYSMPAVPLGLRRVTQRLFRGRCLHNEYLPGTVQTFNDKRADMEAAIIPDGMKERDAKKALKYIDDFYETVNTPKKFNRKIIEACLGPKP